MTTNTTANPFGIVGTDNHAPIYNPNARWQIWNIKELYFGKEGAGKYVPRLGDEVHEIVNAIVVRYVVTSLDQATLIPTLTEVKLNLETTSLKYEDVLLGAGYSAQSETYRVYVDKSVYPYQMTVDARLKVAGSMCAHAKLFKGVSIYSEGIVVSEVYDQNGELRSENIQLETVAQGSGPSTLKIIPSCNTTQELLNGELITAVFYDTQGFVVSKRQLLVENTGYIRTSEANRRYVTGISLQTPFMSTAAIKTINYPLNVPVSSMNLIGIVHYSDGSNVRMAVDGTRFSVAGLEAYAPTVVGQKIQIVAKYVFQPNEYAYGVTMGGEKHISQIYDIVTINAEGTYAVQLYTYPVWIDEVSGYRLEWFMYDLDRGIDFNVTQWVTINTSRAVFQPTTYGVKQVISARLNLSQVDARYKEFTHVQIVEVTLKGPGTNRPLGGYTSNWTTSVTTGKPMSFGQTTYATCFREATNRWRLRVDAGLTTQQLWLNHIYWRTYPLYDDNFETQAPAPTHFKLIAGNNETVFPIAEWNSDLVVNQSVTNGSTVYLKFIKRTSDIDMHLSIAALQLFQVDQSGYFV